MPGRDLRRVVVAVDMRDLAFFAAWPRERSGRNSAPIDGTGHP
jgi:hypothetical protein